MHPVAMEVTNENTLKTGADPARSVILFEDDEVQALWKLGVEADKDWRRAQDAVQKGERRFPPDLALKMTANIAECTVAADGITDVL
ncbi:hypothetical protein K3495_g15253 [Podosphaera aphanis]|nr:hypothetical protein K3495_g15253 [Podosphaera aphanis]